VQNEYTYEPFGTATETGSDANPFQYTGRENDGTGLYYYRERYYHPGLSRFISEDPLDFAAGDSNLYRYVLDNPTNLTDPLGLTHTITVPLPIGPPVVVPVPAPPGPPIPMPVPSWVPVPIPVPHLPDFSNTGSSRWTCTARCNVQKIDKNACCPDRVEGAASGPTEDAACREAKRAAVRSTPSGCYARHCQCSCTKR